jgi:hypothetical protein
MTGSCHLELMRKNISIFSWNEKTVPVGMSIFLRKTVPEGMSIFFMEGTSIFP